MNIDKMIADAEETMITIRKMIDEEMDIWNKQYPNRDTDILENLKDLHNDQLCFLKRLYVVRNKMNNN